MALRGGQHGLYIGHDGLQVLALVQEHAVPVGHLVLPVLLPLAQGVLLEQAVGFYNQFGRCGLEAHTPLDADDGVAHVEVASDGVRCPYFLYLLYGGYLVVKLLTVYGHDFALLKGYF